MEYLCRLGTPDGRVIEERHQGRDPLTLKGELERRGYHVFDVQRPGFLHKLPLPTLRRRQRQVSIEEFLIFNQELAALLRSGLPLLQTLDMMLERIKDPGFHAVMEDIRDRVRSGEDLSEAFSEHGHLFPRLYPATLKAGERSGELEAVIRRFIRYLKLVDSARKKVVSALAYPMVLIALSMVMLTVMGLYVVPKFMGFYSELNAELPMLTQIVLSIVGAVRSTWLIWVPGLIVGSFLFVKWRQTEAGGRTFDRLRLRMPLIGDILHRFALAEFCRSLSTLLSGGIPLVSALEIAVVGIGNAFIRHQLVPTISEVREGQAFHAALENTGVFMDMAIDMVKVGEATGSLDEMLNSVADFLDEQVETRTQRLLSLVEPVMLVFMGLLIGLLLVSIYLPLFSVMGQVQG